VTLIHEAPGYWGFQGRLSNHEPDRREDLALSLDQLIIEDRRGISPARAERCSNRYS